jgi:UDP-glucose 4-epimerase
LSEVICVANRAQTWARCKDFQVYAQRTVSEDHVLTWAADRLGIPVLGHAEIACRYRSAPTGTLVLIDEARRAKVRRIVYAASSSAYGDQPTSKKRETDLPLPISPYGAAKLAAEYYLSAFAAMREIETVSIRYFNVFGPRQDPHSEYSAVIPRFITAMLSGAQPIVYGDGHQSRDFTYVENVARANLLAATAVGASGRVLNIAAGGKISLLELIAALNKLLKMNVSARHEPPRVGDVRESMADITLARQLLGYEPSIGFEEGLRRSIDYYISIAKK